jgi:hypothetical protein
MPAPLPDIHTCQAGNASLVARRDDVVPGIGCFKSVLTCGACPSSCQDPVVASCKQLDFNVAGEFSSSRQRLSGVRRAFSSVFNFLSGWRSTLGTTPGNQPVRGLSSTTAINVVSMSNQGSAKVIRLTLPWHGGLRHSVYINLLGARAIESDPSSPPRYADRVGRSLGGLEHLYALKGLGRPGPIDSELRPLSGLDIDQDAIA